MNRVALFRHRIGIVLAVLCLTGAIGRAESSDSADARAQSLYAGMVRAYMLAEYDAFDDLRKRKDRQELQARLSDAQRADLAYMKRAAREVRPQWWRHVSSAKPVSFTASIWGRDFIANYQPSGEVGYMKPVDIVNGKLRVLVTWRPGLVDQDRVLGGVLARRHRIRARDLAETIAWHELGHNYICEFLPTEDVMALFKSNRDLYMSLQELYADMTALHHAGPRARLATLLFRLDCLEKYHHHECHTRAAHAIGAILLAEFLEHPKRWPSVQFPACVPTGHAELNTIGYVYQNLAPSWTLAEDKALRQLVHDWITRHGEAALKKKGKLVLPNGLHMHILCDEDTKLQQQRDAWVRKMLHAGLKAGRLRTVPPGQQPIDPRDRPCYGNRVEIP